MVNCSFDTIEDKKNELYLIMKNQKLNSLNSYENNYKTANFNDRQWQVTEEPRGRPFLEDTNVREW